VETEDNSTSFVEKGGVPNLHSCLEEGNPEVGEEKCPERGIKMILKGGIMELYVTKFEILDLAFLRSKLGLVWWRESQLLSVRRLTYSIWCHPGFAVACNPSALLFLSSSH